MNKVLGFRKEDGKKGNWHGGIPLKPLYYYEILEDKLVPVHLKSESVELAALEKWCKENFIAEGYSFVWINDLLTWAKKEVSRRAKEAQNNE